MKLEITKYEHKLIDGQPKIIISMIKVMEDDGTYIKFAKLREILPYLSGHPVTFKEMENQAA